MTNDANVSVCLDVILGPFFQLCLLHKNLRLIHDFHVQSVVVVKALKFAVLRLVNQFEDVVAFLDYLLLVISSHVGA